MVHKPSTLLFKLYVRAESPGQPVAWDTTIALGKKPKVEARQIFKGIVHERKPGQEAP